MMAPGFDEELMGPSDLTTHKLGTLQQEPHDGVVVHFDFASNIVRHGGACSCPGSRHLFPGFDADPRRNRARSWPLLLQPGLVWFCWRFEGGIAVTLFLSKIP